MTVELPEQLQRILRANRVVVTGLASTRLPRSEVPMSTVDPVSYLRSRKSRKYLSPQDDIAVVCAGRAIADAGLQGADGITSLGSDTALAMCVGYLSFDRKDTDPVVAVSTDENQRFSMKRFAAEGMRKTHPLLTFRCLPNMPAYHVSVNFGVQGPFLATYPTVSQTYACIEQAVRWLDCGEASTVLVGAVAHQSNFLVDHHLKRVGHPADLSKVFDAGAVIVLELEDHALARGARLRAVLNEVTRTYQPRDVLRDAGPPLLDTASHEPLGWGCASVLVGLAEKMHTKHNEHFPTDAESWTHRAVSIDGHTLFSEWELLP